MAVTWIKVKKIIHLPSPPTRILFLSFSEILYEKSFSRNISSTLLSFLSGVPTNVSCQLFVASLSSINTENMVSLCTFSIYLVRDKLEIKAMVYTWPYIETDIVEYMV